MYVTFGVHNLGEPEVGALLWGSMRWFRKEDGGEGFFKGFGLTRVTSMTQN